MSRAVGRLVTPRLIPFGKDADEQYAILDAIAGTVPNGDVSFDLTHGFRHLGMVGFLSASRGGGQPSETEHGNQHDTGGGELQDGAAIDGFRLGIHCSRPPGMPGL